jgi:hypothetical protein
VAFQIRFALDVGLPATTDTRQFSLVHVGTVRAHRTPSGPPVALASATYDQAHWTLTLTPAAPAPVRQYWLVTQATFNSSAPAGGPVTWTTLVQPPNAPRRTIHTSFPWADLNPLVWPQLL